MSSEAGPYVWGESKHLGTPKEEFDVGSDYWKKWQRRKEEKAELLEAADHLISILYSTDTNLSGEQERAVEGLLHAVTKAKGT